MPPQATNQMYIAKTVLSNQIRLGSCNVGTHNTAGFVKIKFQYTEISILPETCINYRGNEPKKNIFVADDKPGS